MGPYHWLLLLLLRCSQTHRNLGRRRLRGVGEGRRSPARLARRVHHRDFLLRPSALGLLASVAARKKRATPRSRRPRATASRRRRSDRALFDELRTLRAVRARLLAWPEERRGREPSSRPVTRRRPRTTPAGPARSTTPLLAARRLRALSLLGRLGVVGATADQTDSAPLVALLGRPERRGRRSGRDGRPRRGRQGAGQGHGRKSCCGVFTGGV